MGQHSRDEATDWEAALSRVNKPMRPGGGFVLSHLCYVSACVFIGGVELLSCPVTFLCKRKLKTALWFEKSLSTSMKWLPCTSSPVWGQRRPKRKGLPLFVVNVGREEASRV